MSRRTGRRIGTRGRPTLLTEERTLVILEAVEAGNHITTACALAGVHRTTLYRWLRRAVTLDAAVEQGEPLASEDEAYRDFRDRLAYARARAEMRAVATIQRAMVGGQVVRERPVTFKGKPVLDDTGNPLVSRTYAPPDGWLALAFLARSNPREWGPNARPEQFSTGEAGDVNGLPDTETIQRLHERLRACAAERNAATSRGDAS